VVVVAVEVVRGHARNKYQERSANYFDTRQRRRD
jgi:hypothetical protein